MSEYKVGDIVSYKGNKGIVREILDDGTNSKMHRVDVTKTGIHYLYAQELDLYVPSLTEDQQVVLEWLKESCNADDYTTPMLAIYKLYSSQRMAPNLVFLTTEQQFQVLTAFVEWGSKEYNQ